MSTTSDTAAEIPRQIAADAQLLDQVGGRPVDGQTPGTDQLASMFVDWRNELDRDTVHPAAVDRLTELARRGHIQRELLLRRQREPMPLDALENLVRRTRCATVVESLLNAEIAALRGGAR